MSTIKNGQMSLYFHFSETMKGPGNSFQSPAMNEKPVRTVSYSTLVLDQISF